MTFFFFLPSILLSGFMFPFRGYARLGAGSRTEALPLTHFLRVVRGVMLKGANVHDIGLRTRRARLVRPDLCGALC